MVQPSWSLRKFAIRPLGVILCALLLRGCASLGHSAANPSPLSISTTSLPNGQVGVAYNATLSASGGTVPYNWVVSSGTLPAGLALNAATGAITGMPTQ